MRSGHILQCHVDARTHLWLELIAKERGASGNIDDIEQLAEAAIEEAALNAAKERGWLDVR
jgi:hypothetical protein